MGGLRTYDVIMTPSDDGSWVIKSEAIKVIAEKDDEIRRLKRALYKACAEWALSTLSWLDCIDQGNPVKWGEMRRKCLEKVEEYK